MHRSQGRKKKRNDIKHIPLQMCWDRLELLRDETKSLQSGEWCFVLTKIDISFQQTKEDRRKSFFFNGKDQPSSEGHFLRLSDGVTSSSWQFQKKLPNFKLSVVHPQLLFYLKRRFACSSNAVTLNALCNMTILIIIFLLWYSLWDARAFAHTHTQNKLTTFSQSSFTLCFMFNVRTNLLTHDD